MPQLSHVFRHLRALKHRQTALKPFCLGFAHGARLGLVVSGPRNQGCVLVLALLACPRALRSLRPEPWGGLWSLEAPCGR